MTPDDIDIHTAPRIPECSDTGSNWILPDGKREAACWPITAIVRRHAVHLAENPLAERVAVWEEPMFGASCVGVSIVIAWKVGDDKLMGWLDLEAQEQIGKAVQAQFADWTYLPGKYTAMLPNQQQISWIKDKWGRPYHDAH